MANSEDTRERDGDTTPGGGNFYRRAFNGHWQFWYQRSHEALWCWSVISPDMEKPTAAVVLSLEDTWCEPEEEWHASFS